VTIWAGAAKVEKQETHQKHEKTYQQIKKHKQKKLCIETTITTEGQLIQTYLNIGNK
jgi:hypothetical protein